MKKYLIGALIGVLATVLIGWALIGGSQGQGLIFKLWGGGGNPPILSPVQKMDLYPVKTLSPNTKVPQIDTSKFAPAK